MSFSKATAFDFLARAHEAGRLAHAHLLAGPAGCGKTSLSLDLAGLVLGCEPPSVVAHPDAHFLRPESKSRRITVDQIRSLESALSRKPLVGSHKVAVIYDADRLIPASANAFLKTLEEPPQGCYLILTSSLPEALLSTIISRCLVTSLRGDTTQLDPDIVPVIEALGDALTDPAASVATAFRLTRHIQRLLGGVRDRVTAEYAAILKAESKRYKNIEGSSEYLSGREEQIKALTESAALRERDRLIGGMLIALAGALRVQSGGPSPHAACGMIADRYSQQQLLEKIEIWEELRRRLASNINEALALEAGMLALVVPESREVLV